MPQLLFEPVTNKIGDDDYLIVPKNLDDPKLVIRTNGLGAFIINKMWPDHYHKSDIVQDILATYEDVTEEEATAEVAAVVAALRAKNGGGGSE